MIRFVFFCLCWLALTCNASAWDARVVDVTDGDTVIVEPINGGDRIKIRLAGIDAPERQQPYGEGARGYAFEIALYKKVFVDELYKDRYGRTVATVTFEDGKTFQQLMLQAGLAWVWIKYCKDCREWQIIQNDASDKHIGLWADDAPVAPWDWRARKKH